MISLLVVLFFGITGITLNHPSWTFGDDATRRSTQALPDGWNDGGTVDFLAVSEFARNEFGVHGEIGDYGTSGTQGSITYKAAGYAADLFFDTDTGEYTLTVSGRLGGRLERRPQGCDTSSSWTWAIDLSAVLLVLVAVTGLGIQIFRRSDVGGHWRSLRRSRCSASCGSSSPGTDRAHASRAFHPRLRHVSDHADHQRATPDTSARSSTSAMPAWVEHTEHRGDSVGRRRIGATTVAGATWSTGRPERGSITWLYQRPPNCHPRRADPLVARPPPYTVTTVSGATLSYGRWGSSTPTLIDPAPQCTRSPPAFTVTASTPSTRMVAAAARSARWPLASAFRVRSGDGWSGGVSPATSAASSRSVGTSPACAASAQHLVNRPTDGSKAPPLRSYQRGRSPTGAASSGVGAIRFRATGTDRFVGS
jgi:hypothetical protein